MCLPLSWFDFESETHGPLLIAQQEKRKKGKQELEAEAERKQTGGIMVRRGPYLPLRPVDIARVSTTVPFQILAPNRKGADHVHEALAGPKLP